MRLFIALDLSEETVSELERLQTELIDENVKCSLTKSFHLTLKFLGEVKENDVSEILNRLDKVNFKEFSLKLDKLGVFEDNGEIKVLWVGIEKNEILNELYNQIKDALPEFRNDKEFSPHLTLARIKSADTKKLMEKINQTKVQSIDSHISYFSIYKSILTQKGPVYEKIEEFI